MRIFALGWPLQAPGGTLAAIYITRWGYFINPPTRVRPSYGSQEEGTESNGYRGTGSGERVGSVNNER